MIQNMPEREEIIRAKAEGAISGDPVGVTYEEASILGMHPVIHKDGAWGTSAEDIFEFGTDVETETIVLEAEQRAMDEAERDRHGGREAWDALDREHTPSGHGLRRIRPTSGEVPLGRVSLERGF